MPSLFSIFRRQVLLWAVAGLLVTGCETPPPTMPRPSPDRTPPPMPQPVPEPEAEISLPEAPQDDLVRVAVLLPFSNESQNIETIAAAMLKAAQMVAFESDDDRYVLIPKDTRGTAAGAAEMTEEAIAAGADIILGPLFSESVAATADIARPAGVPVIAFSSDSEVAGQGVYLLSFPPEAEIDRVASYAMSKGYARFGLMAPYSEFGDRVAKAFSADVYALGGDIVHTERYERSADAMIAPAKRMAQYAAKNFVPSYPEPRAVTGQARFVSGAESMMRGQLNEPSTGMAPIVSGGSGGQYQAVLLPEQGRLLRALAPLFPYYNVNIREVKLLGVSGWNNPLLTREPALNGGWFAAPDPALAEGFKRRYERAYGEQPPRLASLAYDAALLTSRLSVLPVEERFTVETIANPNGYLGADGLFRLRPDGMVERGLAVLEIRPSGIIVIDDAPQSFVMTSPVGY